eukprot:CAMPEP_0197665372 /NCGR_PEP_ID=MMETSP1338-20131121/59187_1 /TAXON_ID=43686 ORGANISM="Pelagodinium beii, Strain RCC1491" /NCGR_SAMPLE_ID=MMETSP1338 /ASSEMBLY_ACC=CAM_ASM_000754 /LENGTH=108 /DNA_ID=CAMNT_0043244159 /DNA_START=83 /DNA_END=410 /DNA_ORIENTATION=-
MLISVACPDAQASWHRPTAQGLWTWQHVARLTSEALLVQLPTPSVDSQPTAATTGRCQVCLASCPRQEKSKFDDILKLQGAIVPVSNTSACLPSVERIEGVLQQASLL